MASDLQTPTDTSMTSLVTGIINDAQELFKQQLALLKAEVKEDMRKTKEATLSLAVGGGVALLGGLLLVFMLVHLLTWAVGEEYLPLWASFGIVGGVFAVLGGILLYAGKKKFDSFNPLPDETAKVLQENVQWIAKQNQS